MPDTAPPALACPACGAVYQPGPGEPYRCECGHALWFDGGFDVDPGTAPDRGRLATEGLWAFADWLPADRRVTLGEGGTPLVDAPAWDASVKLEHVFPSGSFKDRGAAVLLSRAVGLGVERVLEDSSGNAGAAVAQYAARAGVAAEVYVPADAKPGKLRAIEAAGATPVRVPGDRAAATEACLDAVDGGRGWYASHAWHPAFYAGTATFAFEVAAQRDWTVPDAVVAPLGHGTLFLGAYRGFRALADAGVTDRVPRLYGAQAAGHAPVVAARRGDAGDAGEPTGRGEEPAENGAVPTEGASGGGNDVADGIQIAAPARGGEIHAALDATDGAAVAVGADATERALERLHRGGFYVEPTSAVAPAALDALRERGAIEAGEDVVVPLTGSGLKS